LGFYLILDRKVDMDKVFHQALNQETKLKKKNTKAILSNVITEIHKALHNSNISMLDPPEEEKKIGKTQSPMKLPKIRQRRNGFVVDKEKSKIFVFP
jgi:hypothetical protein